MREYQGHRSWNAWNVSLYINNEENLYRLVAEKYKEGLQVFSGDPEERKRKAISRTVAFMIRTLGGSRTPDGAKYNNLSIKLAVHDILDDYD